MSEKDSLSGDDRGLVRRCQEGDERAFEELVGKYHQIVLNLIYHHIGYRNDVEDIAQKIFSKIYFSLSRFDNQRPFFPWLYRIGINQCYDELRRIRRNRVRTFTELSLEENENIENLVSQNAIPPVSLDESGELMALLHELLDQLPAQQRTALILRDLEDVSYDRMAQILKCSEQAARLKVFRARTRLKALVSKTIRRRRRVGQK